MSDASVQDLLTRFSDAALAYGVATATGDPRGANANQERATQAYRELRAHGSDGRAALLGMLGNSDVAIRYMAAVHALDFAPDEGMRIVQEIRREPPSHPIQMLAEVSLSQWRSGHIHF